MSSVVGKKCLFLDYLFCNDYVRSHLDFEPPPTTKWLLRKHLSNTCTTSRKSALITGYKQVVKSPSVMLRSILVHNRKPRRRWDQTKAPHWRRPALPTFSDHTGFWGSVRAFVYTLHSTVNPHQSHFLDDMHFRGMRWAIVLFRLQIMELDVGCFCLRQRGVCVGRCYDRWINGQLWAVWETGDYVTLSKTTVCCCLSAAHCV